MSSPEFGIVDFWHIIRVWHLRFSTGFWRVQRLMCIGSTLLSPPRLAALPGSGRHLVSACLNGVEHSGLICRSLPRLAQRRKCRPVLPKGDRWAVRMFGGQPLQPPLRGRVWLSEKDTLS